MGSKDGKRQFETDLFLPNIVWLGMHHQDLSELAKSCFLPLSEQDIKKAKSLLAHPAILERPAWGKELEKMLETNTKAEIQAVSSISLSYLSDKYLPQKIECYFKK
eukprot:Phypoly_transcript_13224.p2 GENE.Phypoly_transcript_13224~~Phypoly_transcript_13224.p2  ORF type:complete len:106 (+),score=16.13 Phypoly_transcript_13224:584-901(+)